ncbi:MAG: SCO family protein [Chitinophagaceae bacterium]|nr:SCO family protein [Chitinophagaceae bacterium]
MTKTALYALILAILVPLVSYFIVKKASDSAVHMPNHYLPDSVITTVVNGKKVTDTVWHRLPEFSLTNQLGQKVSWKDIRGKVVVVDFFFTHCPTICPALTKSMKRLQDGITNSKRVGNKTPDFLHLVSLSIDPERDSVPRLKAWADRFQVNPDQWWLLTGEKKEIYDLAINEMKIGIVDGKGVDTGFIHTDHFVLIDTNRYVRGYYHGLDSASVARLSEDIILLTMEKDKKKKGFLSGKLQLLAVIFLMTMGAVAVFLFIFRKKGNHVSAGLEKK